MRKGELCGLKWESVDFGEPSVRVTRQLLRPGREPVFGKPKSKSAWRTIEISPELAELLAKHKKHQAEVKMANRLEYRDLGLVFAKPSGEPLQSNNLGQREFASRSLESKRSRCTVSVTRRPRSRSKRARRYTSSRSG